MAGLSRPARDLVLVTGATGLVGGRIAQLLTGAGHRVRVLARPSSNTSHLDAGLVEVARCDITDPEAVRRAAEGCRHVYHAAGLVSPFIRDRSEYDRVNVAGTRNVLEAAASCGVERVLHVSSVATLGAKPGMVADEATRPAGAFARGYADSKYRSEQLVREYAASRGDAVIVNPCIVFGPRDRQFVRLIRAFLRGRVPVVAFPDRRMSLVYVDDAARGAMLALGHGARGERYVLSGATVTIREFFERLAAASGRRPPRLTVPGWLVASAATAAWAVFPLFRRRPPTSLRGVWRGGATFDGSRAERELGLAYTPLDAGLEATVRWLRATGQA